MSPKAAKATDVHAHVVAPAVFEVTSALTLTLAPARDPSLSKEQRDDILRRSDRMMERLYDVDDRRAAMDAMGVGRQVLSPSLVHQCTYELPSDRSERLERLSNDWIAERASWHPQRYVALGSVPLQTPRAAVVELRRCVGELNMRGVAISTFAGGREIGDPALHDFWGEAEALGASVYVHPAGNRDPRFAPYFLWNSIGQCFEEAMAIASLIYEGVLERFPKLRICVSHGGGYMPANMGRIDRNWLEKPSTRRNMTRPPLAYLKMLWFDSCVYDGAALRNLAGKVGVDRILLGSDYPVGETDPIGFLRASGFAADEIEGICGDNVSRWLGE